MLVVNGPLFCTTQNYKMIKASFEIVRVCESVFILEVLVSMISTSSEKLTRSIQAFGRLDYKVKKSWLSSLPYYSENLSPSYFSLFS